MTTREAAARPASAPGPIPQPIPQPNGQFASAAELPVAASVRRLGPGLALSAIAVIVATGLARLVPTVSAMLVALCIGAALTNMVRLPEAVRPGVAFASRPLLRVGIALLGLQLALSEILGLGAGLLAVVAVVVVLGIVSTVLVGRLLGISRSRTLLIACGFSICGAAAVAATEGVIEAEEEDVITAVALVTIFGTVMILVVPLVGGALGLSAVQIGQWAGASVHEVAQVVAVGGAVGGGALGVAVAVKLARVLLLAPVMAVISVRSRIAARSQVGRPGDTADGHPSFAPSVQRPAAGVRHPPLVPLFVVGFLAAVAVRSTGVLPAPMLDAGHTASTLALTAAMFALGCGVRVASLRRVGLRPVALATVATLCVGSISLAGVLLLR